MNVAKTCTYVAWGLQVPNLEGLKMVIFLKFREENKNQEQLIAKKSLKSPKFLPAKPILNDL